MISWEALDALSHQFELCGIGPGTRVVALLQDGPLADLARASLARSRADVLDVRSVHDPAVGATPLARNPLLAGLVEQADIIVDALAEPAGLQAPPGTRVLRLHPMAVRAQAWPPHANLGARVGHAVERIGAANQLRLADRHGTDLEVRVADGLLESDDGRVDEPARTADYPAGWVRLTPAAGRVNGQLVLMPGDVNLARGAFIDAPIRLEIRDDLITTIDGEHTSADVLRALLERPDRRDAYGVAWLGLGLNPGRWSPSQLFDDDLLDPVIAGFAAGVVTIAFGENLVADRPCPGRIVLALPGRTLFADDVALTSKGELVGGLAPDVYEAPG